MSKQIIFEGDRAAVKHTVNIDRVKKQIKREREAIAHFGNNKELIPLYKLPIAVAIEIRNLYGLDVLTMDNDDLPQLTKIIQLYYPDLLLTDGRE